MNARKSKTLLIISCVIILGLGASTTVLAIKCNQLNNNLIAATSLYAPEKSNNNLSKLTVVKFTSLYNKLTVTVDKISKFTDLKLQNGETLKNFADSKRTVIQLDLKKDKKSIQSIDIMTDDLTTNSEGFPEFANVDFLESVQATIFMTNPHQDSTNIIKDLGLNDMPLDNYKATTVDGVNYTYSLTPPSEGYSKYVAGVKITLP